MNNQSSPTGQGNAPVIDPMVRFSAARVTYNYCGICGHAPRTAADEPNRAPLRWWDCDDGWRIGSLCRHCACDCLNDKPKPADYAFKATNGVCDESNTDEDESEAL